MSEKIILTKREAEKVDEIKQLLNDSNLTIDDVKYYLEKGYEPKKIGFFN